MVRSIRLPYVAHLAVPPALGLITHIEAPVRWHDTWICHDALIEGCHQIDEHEVVDEEEEDSVKAPKLWGPNQADECNVNAHDDTKDGSDKAHAIDALGGEGPSSLHG